MTTSRPAVAEVVQAVASPPDAAACTQCAGVGWVLHGRRIESLTRPSDMAFCQDCETGRAASKAACDRAVTQLRRSIAAMTAVSA